MLMNIDGRKIHFDMVGSDGDPTVCFGHSLAADSGMWAEQVPVLLASGFRVLRIDIQGHGGSDAAPRDVSMEGLAADAARVIEALGIRKVHFVGLSLGGMFGQALALEHRALLESLTICDALPASLPNARAMWGPRVAAVREANSLAPIAEGTISRWLTEDFKARNPSRWSQILQTILGTTPLGFTNCAAAIQSFDFTRRLPTLKLPVLVLCGAEDGGTPPSENKRIADLIPGARFVQIPEAMHLPNVEKPAEFNRELIAWLGSHR